MCRLNMLRKGNTPEVLTHRLTTCSILHSTKDCPRQQTHRDYPQKWRGGGWGSDGGLLFPIGIIVATEDDTAFQICEPGERTVKLQQGDVLLFHGGLLHAGAEYKKPNTRIHVYKDMMQDKVVSNGQYTHDVKYYPTHKYNTRFKKRRMV